MTTLQVQWTSDGVTIRGCLARPQAAGLAPAVIVIHEWWGLSAHIEDIAQRFATAGYVALAPDLYSRLGHKVTTDPQEAGQLMNGLSSQLALRDLNAATLYLKSQPFVDPQRIGVVGFCMGGTFALTMATHNSDIKAAVPFYGQIPPIETLNYLLCPILYMYGGQDTWITKPDVARLQEGLKKYGKPGEVKIYPDCPHAFFNNTRPDVYRPAQAQEAWESTLEFLGRHLPR